MNTVGDVGQAIVAFVVLRTGRARSRFREHTLTLERTGAFRGERAVLTRCVEQGCGWLGWFTAAELTVERTAELDARGGGVRLVAVAASDLGKHKRSGVAVPAPRPAPAPAPRPAPKPEPVPAGTGR